MIKTLQCASQKDGDCPNPSLCFALTSHIDGNPIATKYLKSLILKNVNYDNDKYHIIENIDDSKYFENSEYSRNQKLFQEEKLWIEDLKKFQYLPDKIVLKSLYGSRRRSVLLNSKNTPKQNSRSITTASTVALTGTYITMIKKFNDGKHNNIF